LPDESELTAPFAQGSRFFRNARRLPSIKEQKLSIPHTKIQKTLCIVAQRFSFGYIKAFLFYSSSNAPVYS
jgi:hypothetical protein